MFASRRRSSERLSRPGPGSRGPGRIGEDGRVVHEDVHASEGLVGRRDERARARPGRRRRPRSRPRPAPAERGPGRASAAPRRAPRTSRAPSSASTSARARPIPRARRDEDDTARMSIPANYRSIGDARTPKAAILYPLHGTATETLGGQAIGGSVRACCWPGVGVACAADERRQAPDPVHMRPMIEYALAAARHGARRRVRDHGTEPLGQVWTSW